MNGKTNTTAGIGAEQHSLFALPLPHKCTINSRRTFNDCVNYIRAIILLYLTNYQAAYMGDDNINYLETLNLQGLLLRVKYHK